jgi:hypothetical protein
MYVSNVGKDSLVLGTFDYMTKLTLERKPMFISNGEKPVIVVIIFNK